MNKYSLLYQIYKTAYIKNHNLHLSRERIAKTQKAKLQTLVQYCYQNIKYYRQLFDENKIDPYSIKTAEDIKTIPVLTKNIIRQQFFNLLPKKISACTVSRTSGSTGQPLCVFSDQSSKINNSAAVLRYRKILGLSTGQPIITPIKTPNSPYIEPHWTFLQGIHKTYYINPFRYTKLTEKYLTTLKSPAIIGITPAIKQLALNIKDNHLPPVYPKIVMTIGQTYSQTTRQLFEQIFRCPVADIYACNEAGDIAWQCPSSKLYHINEDNVILEIEKDTNNVILTNLNRFSMPFLRYQNGDMAISSDEKCSCDCQFKTIKKILGRTGDNLTLPTGQKIYWHEIKSIFVIPQLRQYQLIQHKDYSLDVKVVLEPEANFESISTKIKNCLSNHFPDTNIKISKTDFIQFTPAGKQKQIINLTTST